MDEVIKCKDCGNDFTITPNELKWYEEKGLTPPKRCKECRNARKNQKERR